MKKTIGGLMILLLVLSGKSQDENAEIETGKVAGENIDWLLGNWEGTGQLFGNLASFTMNANAFYKYEKDSIVGHWFDSRGTMLPLAGRVIDSTLTIFWGSGKTEQGKTLYQKAGTKIETIDYYLKQGEYHKFGDATYRRQD